jgi:hypothetical protein
LQIRVPNELAWDAAALVRTMNLNTYKEVIEAGGGKFISIDASRNTVFFWNEDETRVLSLYLSAVTAENVRLTLKDAREPVADFPPLEVTEKIKLIARG